MKIDKEYPKIIYGGCDGCDICYGYNEGTYVAPAEYDPKTRTVYLRCMFKYQGFDEMPHTLNHEVEHDIIHRLGENTGIIDVLNFSVKGT